MGESANGGIRGRTRNWALFVGAAVLSLIHCGGRALEDAPGGIGARGGGGTNEAFAGSLSGGTSARASTGGSTQSGGMQTGGALQTGGSAGTGGEGGTICPSLSCPANQRPTTSRDSACPFCATACTTRCDSSNCSAGYRKVDPPPADLCCPYCEVISADGEGGADDSGTCAQGLATYQSDQAGYVTDQALACDSDLDCVLVNPLVPCGSNCAFVVNAQNALLIPTLLTDIASIYCSSCPPPSSSECPKVGLPVCRAQRCTLPTL